MSTNQSKIDVSVRITGKLPRKRKPENFELQIPDGVELSLLDSVATTIALGFIETHKIRDASAYYAFWGVSESTSIDSNGEQQLMVFRDLFPPVKIALALGLPLKK